MYRFNRGTFYKKNIRREPPENSATLCNILSRHSRDHCVIIEDWHEDSNNSMKMDIDVEIDSDIAEELSCLSQPMEVNTNEQCIADSDAEEIEETIANYLQYTSGIPAHRVSVVLDLVNYYEKQRVKANQRQLANRNNANQICECSNNSGTKRPRSQEDEDNGRRKTARK